MKSRRIGTALAVLAIGGAWLGASLAHATSLAPMNLEDLTTGSSQIIVGTVTSVKQARMGSLPCLEIEVKVSETLRGAAQPSIVFRQLDTQGALAPENGRRYLGALPGMPHYTAGEHVMLFLGAPTANGFRTTVGLQQGKFTLAGGNAINEVGNRGLFRNLGSGGAALSASEQSMIATTQGGVGATTLLGLMRRAVAERWWDPAAPPSGKGNHGKQRVTGSTEGGSQR